MAVENIKADYIKLTVENRLARRSLMNGDPNAYEELILDYNR